MECIGPDLICAWTWLGENVASIIALSALGITFWQGWLSRQHNKLSVRPHLIIHFAIDEQKEGCLLRYTLTNEGLGTAVIKSYDLYLDEQLLDISQPDTVSRMITQSFFDIFPLRPQQKIFTTMKSWDKDEAVKAGNEYNLVKVFYGEQEMLAKNGDNLEKARNALHFRITYKSMYDEEFTLRHPIKNI